MSLSTIQSRILQPLIDETLASLKAMAGMDGHTDEAFIDQVNKFHFKGYAICAETHGCIDGVMLMHHYVETAVAMGNSIRKHVLDDDEVHNDIDGPMADALAEWTNTVLGRATKGLSRYRLNIGFEAPYFIFDTDTMSSILTGVSDIITVPVHVDGVGRFYFNYLIRSVNSELADLDNGRIEAAPDSEHCVVIDRQETGKLDFDKKIMIVDDMKMVRSSLKLYLRELGYKYFVEAENGHEAVDKHSSENPDFIFMDMVMPEMNGSEALRIIRAKSLQTPVVMLTSVADDDVVRECESLGIEGYVVKPLTRENGPEVLGRFLR